VRVEAGHRRPIRIMPGLPPQVHRTLPLPAPSHIKAIPGMLKTRRVGWILGELLLVIGTHFAGPTAGHVIRAFKLVG
jgi:hypothetical protein